ARQKIFIAAQKLAAEGDRADWHELVTVVDSYKAKLRKAWSAGTDEFDPQIPCQWHLKGAVYFCITLFTTIGYGNLTPSTNQGKVLTLIYGLVAIPLFALILSRIALWITKLIKTVSILSQESNFIPTGLRDAYYRANTCFDFPFASCLGFLAIYLLIGASIYSWALVDSEHSWTLLDSVYFAFISLTTVGFGDLIPEADKFFSFISVLYLVMGLALGFLVLGRFNEILSQLLDEWANPKQAQETTNTHHSRFAQRVSAENAAKNK
ncbi:Potassium channel subfamily K member 10, partial [Cichlidogyrus casuarinus]